MSEMRLMHEIMLELTKKGYTVFRTNVGKVRTPDGRYFDTGLPKGHSDLYGFRRDGQIFYIEVKVKPNKPTVEQILFVDAMQGKGALAGIAYSVKEALEIARGDRGNSEGPTH